MNLVENNVFYAPEITDVCEPANKYSQNQLVLIYTFQFLYESGGIVTLYTLCKTLRGLGINAKLWCIYPEDLNDVCNDYYNKSIPIDLDKTIVIYPEVVHNNPVGAKHVIYWMLGPYAPIKGFPDWKDTDYVYFFHSDIYFNENEVLSIPNANNVYKFLSMSFMHPEIAKASLAEIREGYCHVIHKAFLYGASDFSHHPPNSVIILNMTQAIQEFSKREYLVCYDPLTFYTIAAPLCGCITIMIGLPNVSKKEWIDRLAIGKYFKHVGHYNFYGIAYGDTEAEISFAKSTLYLAKQQWDDIVTYFQTSTLLPFIQDLNNLASLSNTVKNVFRTTNEELRDLCLILKDKIPGKLYESDSEEGLVCSK
jgi:hypothetical protein